MKEASGRNILSYVHKTVGKNLFHSVLNFFFVRLMLQGCCVIILSENTRPDYAAVACAADLKELYFASDFPWVLCETAP